MFSQRAPNGHRTGTERAPMFSHTGTRLTSQHIYARHMLLQKSITPSASYTQRDCSESSSHTASPFGPLTFHVGLHLGWSWLAFRPRNVSPHGRGVKSATPLPMLLGSMSPGRRRPPRAFGARQARQQGQHHACVCARIGTSACPCAGQCVAVSVCVWAAMSV